MRQLFVVILLLLALLPSRPAAAQERYPVTITRVVDGDTVQVRFDSGATATVRLIGIDTPETKHPTKPVQCFGVASWSVNIDGGRAPVVQCGRTQGRLTYAATQPESSRSRTLVVVAMSMVPRQRNTFRAHTGVTHVPNRALIQSYSGEAVSGEPA